MKREVKQPVSWQTAIEAWATDNKDIYCEIGDEVYSYEVLEYKNNESDWVTLQDSYGDSISTNEIIHGTWYIRN